MTRPEIEPPVSRTIGEGDIHSVMVFVAGNGHREPSSNPQRSFLHFTFANTFEKGKNPTILAMGK